MKQNSEHEFMLFDRITKIQSVFRQYGIENFCISYSGGKDSNVLSALIDLAVPNNHIPRLYVDTGIEMKAVRDFVYEKAKQDVRFHIISPQKNIKKILEEYGYPFKSKLYSKVYANFKKRNVRVEELPANDFYRMFYERNRYTQSGPNKGKLSFDVCPKKLQYQFREELPFKISDKCCEELKEKPLSTWKKKMNFCYDIIGIRAAEGGRRASATCMAFSQGKLRAFQPLAVVSDEFEQYVIEKYDIKLPILYYPPYNFDRTGCKGCPFAPNLQHNLDILEKFFPAERKQCEIIWKPVYEEYRRINYRLKGE